MKPFQKRYFANVKFSCLSSSLATRTTQLSSKPFGLNVNQPSMMPVKVSESKDVSLLSLNLTCSVRAKHIILDFHHYSVRAKNVIITDVYIVQWKIRKCKNTLVVFKYLCIVYT